MTEKKPNAKLFIIAINTFSLVGMGILWIILYLQSFMFDDVDWGFFLGYSILFIWMTVGTIDFFYSLKNNGEDNA